MANSLLPAPRNPVTPTLNDLVAAGAFARDVGNAAVVEPVKEIGRGLSDLATGQGVSPDVGAGLFAAMGLLSPMKAGVLTKGIRAYHGSPYKFDKFSMDRIGTGEGAQSYGHGLYFAEQEATAKAYRDALASPSLLDPDTRAAQALKSYDSRADAISNLKQILSISDPHPQTDALRSAIQILERGDTPVPKSPGHMYEVNIRANPEQFLDWDRPLGQQSQNIQSVLFDKMGVPESLGRGEDVYRDAAMRNYPRLPSSMAYAEGSRAFREAGIPGIKYLDQGSRDAGQGSSNYVVFDDKLIDIMKRYGIAGAGLSGLMAMSAGDQQ